MTRRVQVTVYVDAEQKEALDKLTKRSSLPWAFFVREGIDMVIDKYSSSPAGIEIGRQQRAEESKS